MPYISSRLQPDYEVRTSPAPCATICEVDTTTTITARADNSGKGAKASIRVRVLELGLVLVQHQQGRRRQHGNNVGDCMTDERTLCDAKKVHLSDVIYRFFFTLGLAPNIVLEYRSGLGFLRLGV